MPKLDTIFEGEEVFIAPPAAYGNEWAQLGYLRRQLGERGFPPATITVVRSKGSLPTLSCSPYTAMIHVGSLLLGSSSARRTEQAAVKEVLQNVLTAFDAIVAMFEDKTGAIYGKHDRSPFVRVDWVSEDRAVSNGGWSDDSAEFTCYSREELASQGLLTSNLSGTSGDSEPSQPGDFDAGGSLSAVTASTNAAFADKIMGPLQRQLGSTGVFDGNENTDFVAGSLRVERLEGHETFDDAEALGLDTEVAATTTYTAEQIAKMNGDAPLNGGMIDEVVDQERRMYGAEIPDGDAVAATSSYPANDGGAIFGDGQTETTAANVVAPYDIDHSEDQFVPDEAGYICAPEYGEQTHDNGVAGSQENFTADEPTFDGYAAENSTADLSAEEAQVAAAYAADEGQPDAFAVDRQTFPLCGNAEEEEEVAAAAATATQQYPENMTHNGATVYAEELSEYGQDSAGGGGLREVIQDESYADDEHQPDASAAAAARDSSAEGYYDVDDDDQIFDGTTIAEGAYCGYAQAVGDSIDYATGDGGDQTTSEPANYDAIDANQASTEPGAVQAESYDLDTVHHHHHHHHHDVGATEDIVDGEECVAPYAYATDAEPAYEKGVDVDDDDDDAAAAQEEFDATQNISEVTTTECLTSADHQPDGGDGSSYVSAANNTYIGESPADIEGVEQEYCSASTVTDENVAVVSDRCEAHAADGDGFSEVYADQQPSGGTEDDSLYRHQDDSTEAATSDENGKTANATEVETNVNGGAEDFQTESDVLSGQELAHTMSFCCAQIMQIYDDGYLSIQFDGPEMAALQEVTYDVDWDSCLSEVDVGQWYVGARSVAPTANGEAVDDDEEGADERNSVVWERCIPQSFDAATGLVETLFADIGLMQLLPLDNFRPIRNLDTIAAIPPQAVTVAVDGVSGAGLSTSEIQALRDRWITDPTDCAWVFVLNAANVSKGDDGVPHVQLVSVESGEMFDRIS